MLLVRTPDTEDMSAKKAQADEMVLETNLVMPFKFTHAWAMPIENPHAAIDSWDKLARVTISTTTGMFVWQPPPLSPVVIPHHTPQCPHSRRESECQN